MRIANERRDGVGKPSAAVTIGVVSVRADRENHHRKAVTILTSTIHVRREGLG
jgi:hypothetical protein